jgi:hypothetical protein
LAPADAVRDDPTESPPPVLPLAPLDADDGLEPLLPEPAPPVDAQAASSNPAAITAGMDSLAIILSSRKHR